jgi:hypothetical protein
VSALTVPVVLDAVRDLAVDDDLIEQIRHEHDAVQQSLRDSVAHAMRCGELLIQAKAALPHGYFSSWLRDNVTFSDRTARAYMRLAAFDEAKRQRVADLSLRQALEEIADVVVVACKQEDVEMRTYYADVSTETTPAKTIVVQRIEEPPKEPTVITLRVIEPDPPAARHYANADEVREIASTITNRLSDADLCLVISDSLDAFAKRALRLRGGPSDEYVSYLANWWLEKSELLRKKEKKGAKNATS